MELMNVREAARELQVHENTLRRWEEAGLIHAVHLPTGIRRFTSSEVERLKSGMYANLIPDSVKR
jgi:DNA-binding transcriptional MerR regulator